MSKGKEMSMTKDNLLIKKDINKLRRKLRDKYREENKDKLKRYNLKWEKIRKNNPGLFVGSKRSRILRVVDTLIDVDEQGSKVLVDSYYNPQRWVNGNKQYGGLEDCTVGYIMQVCRSLGYKCHESNFGAIILRKNYNV